MNKKQPIDVSSIAKINLIINIITLILVIYIMLHLSSVSTSVGNSAGQSNSSSKNLTALLAEAIYGNTNITVSRFNNTPTVIYLAKPNNVNLQSLYQRYHTFTRNLVNADQPFNSTALSIINNASNELFNKAGYLLLNNSSIASRVIGTSAQPVPMLIVNNKPSVIYFGSTTCIFCGENRWAMALALSRFGYFKELFIGYSSFGDGDEATIYWADDPLLTPSDVLGNYYVSKYINFISIEDTNNITQGFNLNPLNEIQASINSTNNPVYMEAIKYVTEGVSLSSKQPVFSGTPLTVWGKYAFSGADAVDFGLNNSEAVVNNSAVVGLTEMTHGEVLQQIANPTTTFGWTEYAAADVYIAALCLSVNNTYPACNKIQSIKLIEQRYF